TTISLFALAFAIRAGVALSLQFDGLYGQDPFAYFKQAVAIAENLPRGELPPRDFFWPNGYPLLAAVFMWAMGKTASAAQLVNLLFGAALAPLVYALSQAVLPKHGHQSGILAGLIVAVAGQPILSSVVAMADIPSLFWATLGTLLLARVWDGNKYDPRKLALAGAALGLAVITRWVYALLAVPFAIFALYQIRKHKTPWWHLAAPTLVGMAILIPQVWLSSTRPGNVSYGWLVGWRPWNALTREFSHVDGYYNYLLPTGLFYLQPAGHPSFMFPLFGLAAAWGLWQLWRAAQNKHHWEMLILIAGWGIVIYAFFAGFPYQNLRYGLAIYPPLLVLAGFGSSELLNMVAPKWFPKPTFWKLAIQLGIAFSLLSTSLWAARANYRFLTPQNHSKAIAQQIEATLPEDATLLAFGITLTLEYYTNINVLEFFYFDSGKLEALIAETNPTYLLLDTQNIATQWQGKALDTNYQWLQDNTILTQLAYYPPYTLFQIQAHDAEK
ncbi:MAG: phospholipid carrier-dependent glycosyltransferase, partial [Chloroflexi bacterium]|nr:phospholipid carrier-dependent glycosyltransferase [Chloroflexota bacterium]